MLAQDLLPNFSTASLSLSSSSLHQGLGRGGRSHAERSGYLEQRSSSPVTKKLGTSAEDEEEVGRRAAEVAPAGTWGFS